MKGLLISLLLVLLGVYLSNILLLAIGLFCFAAIAYLSRSRPVRSVQKESKTRHRVIMGEPPESTFDFREIKGLPIETTEEGLDFLPLPDYGYSDPLEKLFFGIPIKFWKK